MKLLLDTHLLLWTLSGSRRMPREAKRLLLEAGNESFISAASIWEIAIKSGLGRTDFRIDVAKLQQALPRSGFQELSVTAAHAAHVALLPALHRDPFDRLLVAQSLMEPMTLLTNDAALGRYGAQVVVV